jgi:glycosyltransferase involved in cell wall biosynthesis
VRQLVDQSRAGPADAAPKVSVVVPTFKRAGLLKETVESILAQTYSNFELIIVDNMSDDGTEAYVTGLSDSRVRYFRNPNGGIIAVNRNFGIRQARGEYVALCDDDDLWLPEKLARQVPVLDSEPEVGLCYTNASTFDANGEIDQWMMKKVFDGHYQKLLIGNMIPNSTVLVRRRLLEGFGYLDARPESVAVEDYCMWLKIARQHRLCYVDEALMRYRVHAAANSRNLTVMAEKTFRICLAEFRDSRLSSYHLYALCRSFVRMTAQRLLS